MGPLVASTSRKLTTHSLARVESREFTVVVFPNFDPCQYICIREDGTVGGIVAESKNFPLHIWSTVVFTPVSRQKKILGTPFVRH